MILFPTKYLILCGPDCAGKTSLYQSTHKASNFTWNIQDRSWLSMLIYGITYGRDTRRLSQGLWEELTCLNNRVFLVMPPWKTVEDRFKKRGDEHQNLESLRRLYGLFEEYKDDLQHLPNFEVVDNSEMTKEEAGQYVTGIVRTKEDSGLDEISAEVLRFVSNVPNTLSAKDCESTINFAFYDDTGFEEDDPDILNDLEEGSYYVSIKDTLVSKIQSEINGVNEYGEPQGAKSRRFVYADTRCISFIQVTFRKGVMDVHTVLRSSNVAKTFHKDLQFIYHLGSFIYNKFGELRSDVSEVRFRFNINSAHLVR